jgi:hypothetical protein
MVPPSPIGAGPQLPPKFVFRPGLKSRMNQRRGVEAARTDYQCFKNCKGKLSAGFCCQVPANPALGR